MPRESPYQIVLSPDEKRYLQEMERRYTAPYYEVIRAKVVLLAAEGFENKEIGKRLGLPRQIVSKWRKRFFDERVAGLCDRPRRGRPSRFSP
jgi:transposase